MLVVLERLTPAERLAFVLHDLFAVPFDDIGLIVDRTPEAARQLASRARRRVRGGPDTLTADRAARREVLDAFLSASREGDFSALIRMLDPDVVVRGDEIAARLAGRPEVRGREDVARMFLGRATAGRVALVDGEFGVVVAPAGDLRVVLKVAIREGRIVEIFAVADPEALLAFDIAVPEV